jgi:hypothetical protein
MKSVRMGTNLAPDRPTRFNNTTTMLYKWYILYLCGILGLNAALYGTDSEESASVRLEMPADQINVILRQTCMPDLGRGRLAKILTRYYIEGFGGPEVWEKISSLKVSGNLLLKEGEFELNAFQKKPDLIKVSMRDNQREWVLGYDGETAWREFPGANRKAEPMPADEARRFKHNAHFGNHLLYPFASGKTIEYMDTIPVEGTICHQIRVTLDTDYQVDYFIDIRTYLEIKAVNTDLRTGEVNSLVYQDYFREYGMPIARQVESFEDGEWVSSLRLDEVKVNAGVMPWMFKM